LVKGREHVMTAWNELRAEVEIDADPETVWSVLSAGSKP
jgi:uncharacterized protein YndB with AHSA1/START domain